MFTRLWQRGLEQIERIVSDDAAAILQAAAVVYPSAAHQLCLAPWFRNLEALTPPLAWTRRRKFRREFWWLGEADDQRQLRLWAASFHHLRRYLGRFPGCTDAAHSEQILGCFLLASEVTHA